MLAQVLRQERSRACWGRTGEISKREDPEAEPKKRKGVVTNGAIDLVSSPVYVTDVLIITLGLATIFSYAPGPQDLKLCCPLWLSDL